MPAPRAGRCSGFEDDVPLVVAFGRLVEKKGFAYLIDAAANLKNDFPSLRIVVAGEGDLGASLRARAVAAGVADRVQLIGDISQDRVPALLAAADVAVAPSVHDDAGNVDGLPNVVMEIMASGTPLVATPVGGIGAVAIDGRTASLVPERDADALADAIATLIRQPAAGLEMGRRARETVCRDYSWSRVADAFDDIYTRVNANPHPNRAR